MSSYGYLTHHGIEGQKWGVRRYQNPDGSLTPAGRERYYKNRIKELKNEYNSKTASDKRSKSDLEKYIKEHYGDSYKKDKKIYDEAKRVRTGAAIGLGATAVVAGAFLTTEALSVLSTVSMLKAGQRENDSLTDYYANRVENILNDEQSMDKLDKDSKVYRMVFGDPSGRSGSKLMNESLYVTNDQTDRELYKQVLNPSHQGGGAKSEVTYKLKNNVYTAQGKVLFDFALEAIGSNKALDNIDTDACIRYEKSYGRDKKPEGYDDYQRAYKAIFGLVNKDSRGHLTGDDSSKLRNKLIEEGYGAVKDYQDSGILGKTPKILLDSYSDAKVDTIKEVDEISEILSRLKLGALKLGK